MPKVSVIVAAYNHDAFLARCLRSLLAQKTNFDYEIVVVEDSSSDGTPQVLESFGDSITILRNKSNLGLAASVNLGIHASRGEFVVRVDSDDFVSEHFIQTLTLALDMNPESMAFACNYVQFDDGQESRGKTCSSLDMPIACGIMFRRDALFSIGLYDPKFRFNEEKELRVRFEKKYRIENLPIPLYRYRRHATNITNDGQMRREFDSLLGEKHNLSSED